MILLEPQHIAALEANTAARRAAQAEGRREPDPAPLVKFFNPMGAATWLVTELCEDGDSLFGLADLGFGCPELGYFSLTEIAAIRLPFGLRIERDIAFNSLTPISIWSDWSRRTGSIIMAQAKLAQAPHPLPPGFDPEMIGKRGPSR
ncbi:DUF2958 domain-containing protein [Sphingobium fuliginis]|jgi:hypothetical protein|uniref:DUF2958 domain-containing protein n=1 Tax=Sphingobium fuliginis (strain ATCC 27551) TaxID=336203 RepID=A0A7M2GH65_SPHSA|nr:DUF2958 domain-containing protein [Sphingobium fuliginis]QOT71725.1 DUF2958 domain-containing protein [Sphingobium fuliginis]